MFLAIAKAPRKNRHDSPQALPTPYLDDRRLAAITALKRDALGVAQARALLGARIRFDGGARDAALAQLGLEYLKRLRLHSFAKNGDAIQQILRARLPRVGRDFLAIEFHWLLLI